MQPTWFSEAWPMVRQEVVSQGNREIGKDPWAASLTGLLVGMDYDWAGKGWKLGKNHPE